MIKPNWVHAALLLFCWIGIDTAAGQSDEITTRIAIGRVVNSAGLPVAGARVVCRVGVYPEQHEATTETDEQGRFRLLYEDHPDAFSNAWLWVDSPDYCMRCVSQRQRQQHEIVLPDMQEFTITVQGTDGSPLEKAIVEPCYFESPNGVYSSDKPTGLSNYLPQSLIARLAVSTDEKGQAVLRGIPRELLSQVLIRHAAYGSQQFKTGEHVAMRACGNLVLTVPKEHLATVGVINITSTDNGLRSALASGVAAFDESGVCSLPPIAAGELELQMQVDRAGEKQPFLPEGLSLIAGDRMHIDIEFRDTIPISGRILAGDRGVANAKIAIRGSGMNRQTVTSDSEGAFRARVFPGDVSLQVFVLDGDTQKQYKYPPSKRVTVAVNDDQFVVDNFILPPQEFIRGKVVDADGKPVVHRYVAAIETSPYGFALFGGMTDDQGNFEAVLSRDREDRNQRGIEYMLFTDQKSFRSRSVDENVPRLKVIDLDPLTLKVIGELPE